MGNGMEALVRGKRKATGKATRERLERMLGLERKKRSISIAVTYPILIYNLSILQTERHSSSRAFA